MLFVSFHSDQINPSPYWLKGLRAMSEAAAMWWFKELKVVKVVAKL